MTPVVEATGVCLDYRLARSSAGSLKEFVIHLFKRQVQYERLRALDDVSLQLERGEVLAVIGANGAGKSTLMKVLARVLSPTEGRVVVRGRVAPMIELGAGFNSELTGAENTQLYGTILGRTAAEMKLSAPRIAEWADLVDYMDVPLRSYSSGMLARLAFSVAVDTHPDLLLVDEVLSVGDEVFQRRSAGRIKELIGQGTAVILVSHSMETVRAEAHRVLWLHHGRVRAAGAPDDIVNAYLASTQLPSAS
ncbi:MAG: ABC transporter ATP-binding protein [Mycobacteriales bacterium]